MSKQIFQDRIKRIERNGPSGATIPGQVGEMTAHQARSINKPVRKHTKRRSATVLTSLLFGGILGAIVGLFFQQVVGAEALLGLDFEAELALVQTDLMRMVTWASIVAGACLLIVTLPSRKRFKRMAFGSLAYMGTAIAVNAQEFIALLPAGS